MYELSLFILELAQNSLTADAGLVKIWLVESGKQNMLTVTVADNGCGMTPEILEKAVDPFMTTKQQRHKKIGLGLLHGNPAYVESFAEVGLRRQAVAGPPGKVVNVVNYRLLQLLVFPHVAARRPSI